MTNLEFLHKKAYDVYPLNVEGLDESYDSNAKIIELKKLIKKNRTQFETNRYIEKLQDSLIDVRFRDMTYFYATNPSIRLGTSMTRRYNGAKIFISLIYPIFSINGDIVEQLESIKKVFSGYEYVDMKTLISIRMRNISCNDKLIEDTTLFDCYFSDPD